MRKLTAIITAFAASVICGISASAASVNIWNDDILSAEEEQAVVSYADDVSAETGWNIDIYVTDGIDVYEDELYRYCIDSFERDFGYDADGVLFLCDTDYTYLITSGRATDYISINECEYVARSGNDYYGTDNVKSITTVLDGVRLQYEMGIDSGSGGHADHGAYDNSDYNNNGVYDYGAYDSGGFDLTGGIVVGIVLAAIIVAVILISVHTGYKTYAQPVTNNYLNAGSLRFNRREDKFIRRSVTRVPVGEGGGSHGGSPHGGGGGHHGGGGHR